MMTRQPTLFEEHRMTLEHAIGLTADYLNSYFQNYRHVAIAFSGGKDSSALVSLVCHLIETERVVRPEKMTVIYADTRMELPPLHASAMAMLDEVKKRGFETKIAMAPLDKRFLVYILGRGVPPPNNSTLRWCTNQIKVQPMMTALEESRQQLDASARLLMLTGVRIGESAARDQRIAVSCTKNGSECGQGWFQYQTYDRTDTFAPIVHWRVCNVWDWLLFGRALHGFPTELVAEAYGGNEAEELNARTGCLGCPLTDKETALDAVLEMPDWAYLQPLKRLKPIYEEMRLKSNRHRKDGSEVKKDGTLVKNPGRVGPLTLQARLDFLGQILAIQQGVNLVASQIGRPQISLINEEEESRIRELIKLKTFPNKWDGTEINGAELINEVYPDGSVQPLLPLWV